MPARLERYVRVFEELDQDGGGTVSADEMRAALDAVGIPAARIGKILSIVDKDGSGDIDREEWMAAIVTPAFEQELQELVEATESLKLNNNKGNL
jgi:Ca2+-binding EF-hand superfamily protein